MAEFTVDVTQLEDVARELKNLSSRADDISRSVQSIGQSLRGIKSLANKGYPQKISSVRSGIKKVAEGTKQGQTRLNEILMTYSNCESRIVSAVENEHTIPSWVTFAGGAIGGIAGSGLVGGAGGTILSDSPAFSQEMLKRLQGFYHYHATKHNASGQNKPQKKSWWEILKESFYEAWNDTIKDFKESPKILDDFRKWRRTKGSEIVEAVAGVVGKHVPGWAGWIREKAEDLGKKAKRIEEIYDGTVGAFTGDTKAMSRGVSAFCQEVGIPDLPSISEKYLKRGDYYAEKYKEMRKNGASKSQAVQYLVAGTIHTIGELTVDTAVQFTRFAAKVLSGGKAEKVMKVLGLDHKSGFFSGIGDFFRSGIDHMFGVKGK